MSTPRFCEQCGAPTDPGASFCVSCGQPLAAAGSAQTPNSASPAQASGPANPVIPASVTSAAYPDGPANLPRVAGAAPPAKRGSRAWVAVVLVLLVFALVGGGFYYFRGVSPASASNRSAAGLQAACEAQDSQAAATLVHPVLRGVYGKILDEHQAELPRLGKLLATRKLVSANADVAEYEVIEDGETFIVTFERQGQQWLLSGL